MDNLRPLKRGSTEKKPSERQKNAKVGLMFFGVGVEAGHFLFIGVVLSLIALVRRVRISFPRWTELVPPYAIGTIAMFWAIQRTLSFSTF